VVINGTSGGFAVTLRGAGPTTGISIAAGEYAVCAWNGSDFVKVSSLGGSGTFSSLTLTGGSANTVPYLNGSKEFTSSANLTFDANTLNVGNVAPYTSVTQPGVVSIGGYGNFQYIGFNGLTTTTDTGVALALQNPVIFSGNNGLSFQRLNMAVANPRISNTGAGGTQPVLVNGFFGSPNVTTTGLSAVISMAGVQGLSARSQAGDTSQSLGNIIRGGVFGGAHLPGAGAGIVSGSVYGALGQGVNYNGTVTSLIGVMGQCYTGVDPASPINTTTNASQFAGNLFQVGAPTGTASTVTNGYGVNITGPTIDVTGVMTNYYAFYASAPTVTGTLTNRWGVYIADSLSPNYFAGNVLVGGTSSPGQGVVYMANAAVVPASNPTGGGVLYVEGGALKYRGSGGTVTTIANA
jgi:hypothetical protein